MAFLPAQDQQPSQEEIERKKIAEYQEWNKKLSEQEKEDQINRENWQKMIEAKLQENQDFLQQQEVQ